jgi:hypothetical protein
MAEDKKNISGLIENIAFATDKLQTTYPDGKICVLIELNDKDYRENQFNFDNIKLSVNQFKIDISDVEVLFIKENTFNIENKKEEIKLEPQKNIFQVLYEKLTFKKSS